MKEFFEKLLGIHFLNKISTPENQVNPDKEAEIKEQKKVEDNTESTVRSDQEDSRIVLSTEARKSLDALPESFARIDYAPLQDLLETRQFQAADELTRQLILEIAGRQGQGLREFDILCLPGSDLKIIDRLWRAHGQYSLRLQCKNWKDKKILEKENRNRFMEYFSDKIEYLSDRIARILAVKDGDDFPCKPIDWQMNRRQESEKIEPEPEALALLEDLPESTAGMDYQTLRDNLSAGNLID